MGNWKLETGNEKRNTEGYRGHVIGNNRSETRDSKKDMGNRRTNTRVDDKKRVDFAFAAIIRNI